MLLVIDLSHIVNLLIDVCEESDICDHLFIVSFPRLFSIITSPKEIVINFLVEITKYISNDKLLKFFSEM